MARQHACPLLLTSGSDGAVPLVPLADRATVTEADIQALVQAHPGSLPIAEIDAGFIGPVPICTELNTPAGPIDNFMVTPSGLPVLVECKLWRNPEGRREVVGQILDYAKELSRWSSSDLHREVNRRLKRDGNALLDLVRAIDPTVDETQFNDALTVNLRRGRFLLLIVGDGIREGVEAIAEYLQAHAGLHFSLGLVELPIYVLPNGDRLVAPRVLARTTIITRHVLTLPDGHYLESPEDAAIEPDVDPERNALGNARKEFWAEFLADFVLDDPEQPRPKPSRLGYLSFMLPAPNGSSWLTVYRDMMNNEVGVFLSASRNSAGEYAMLAIVDDWDAVKIELGPGSELRRDKYDRPRIIDAYSAGPLADAEVRKRAFSWLSERVNAFVNALRPRVRSAVASYEARNE